MEKLLNRLFFLILWVKGYSHDTGYLLLATKPDSNQEKDKDFMPYCSQLMSESGCELAYCWGQDMCRKRPLFASFTQRRVMGKGSKQRQRSLFILDLPFSWKASLLDSEVNPVLNEDKKASRGATAVPCFPCMGGFEHQDQEELFETSPWLHHWSSETLNPIS